jgi:YggT family protein
MLTTALIFLIETAAGIFTVALLLRFLLQWARAAQRNPVSDFFNALTNWAVRPARRIIPGLWGLDLATFVLAWFTQVVQLFLVLTLQGYQFAAPQAIAAIVLLGGLMVIRLLLYIVIVIVIVQAVLSWVNPYSPIAPLLNSLTRPLLRPFQRRIPPLANVDLSPLFVIIACQLLLMLPVAYLTSVLTGMLLAR